MLSIITDLEGNFSPTIIKTDFEQAAITAFQRKFPQSRLSGCIFHLGQAIQRKLPEFRLKTLYDTTRKYNKYVKYLVALSFVAPERVHETFNEIKNTDEFDEILLPLYNYFESTYIQGVNTTRFAIELWNTHNFVENNIPRTNNAIEGWHYIFKSTFGAVKYSFTMLVKMLKDEEDNIRIKKIRSDLGHSFPRKQKYIDLFSVMH